MKNYTELRKATNDVKSLERKPEMSKLRETTMTYGKIPKIRTARQLLAIGRIDFMQVSGDDAIIVISGIDGLVPYPEKQGFDNLERKLTMLKLKKPATTEYEFRKLKIARFVLSSGHIKSMDVSGDNAIIIINGLKGLVSYSEEQEVNTHGKVTRGKGF